MTLAAIDSDNYSFLIDYFVYNINKGGETLLNPNEKYAYWEDIAEYDLKTTEAMYQSGRYLYVVFMCQQALEKLVKGLYIFKLNEEPPRTREEFLWLKSLKK